MVVAATQTSKLEELGERGAPLVDVQFLLTPSKNTPSKLTTVAPARSDQGDTGTGIQEGIMKLFARYLAGARLDKQAARASRDSARASRVYHSAGQLMLSSTS